MRLLNKNYLIRSKDRFKPFSYSHNAFINKDLITKIQKKTSLRISTLGPEGTSSEHASSYFLKLLNIKDTSNIITRPSFEDACDDVVSGITDMFVVANAYSKIDAFYMNQDLSLVPCNSYKFG